MGRRAAGTPGQPWRQAQAGVCLWEWSEEATDWGGWRLQPRRAQHARLSTLGQGTRCTHVPCGRPDMETEITHTAEDLIGKGSALAS